MKATIQVDLILLILNSISLSIETGCFEVFSIVRIVEIVPTYSAYIDGKGL